MDVRMWVDTITLPTYPVGEPNRNPLFLEKRVYQGSSGKIYPLPFTDTLSDEKKLRAYDVVMLENDYLQITIMPEMGGKIYRALDKTNQYDFVYYNHVVKPALVGLTGPWVSGGIEFNWPQHHRPTTFSPVDYRLVENEDGSKTCWVGEIDRMYGTQGMAGFTLYPDKAYLEVRGQLYNRTEIPQTFLWWANPAVAVNDHTQSVFPPDVHAVFDHGKRDVSKFPIASGIYYKMDYSEGVDISRYRNIPVPTSYMAYRSDYDFVGGYDFAVGAGILHYASHHISPGKKQWTWGNGDFGRAWDGNLTDDDGPYIELMTGVFTDNQPDFSWLAPKEEKSFTQYFLPYKGVGRVKNATLELLINLERSADGVDLCAYATSRQERLKVQLLEEGCVIHEEEIAVLDPSGSFMRSVSIQQPREEDCYEMRILDAGETVMIRYRPEKPALTDVPEPAKAPGLPHEIRTTEELFLIGQHLEQYRHATYLPEDYYLEALRREEGDIRNNNAYGLLMYRRGRFAIAVDYFQRAIDAMTQRNPNPYDSEAYYNLGLALRKLGRLEPAYAAFYKSTWNYAYQSSAFYEIACIDALVGRRTEALRHVELSLIRNTHHIRARNLKTVLLRCMGRQEQAALWNEQTIGIDPLSPVASWEKGFLDRKVAEVDVVGALQRDVHVLLETAMEYGYAGFYTEAERVLTCGIKEGNHTYPMVHYFLGYYQTRMGKVEQARASYEQAAADRPDYCFANRLEEILVLEEAIGQNGRDAKALYYLANLYYDKRQYELAMELWSRSIAIDDSFATAYRNLALACVNQSKDYGRAKWYYEKAFALDPSDARVFFELDQLEKKMGSGTEIRLDRLQSHMDLVRQRDDLYVEYVTLLNMTDRYEAAIEAIDARRFHPWEGGEGKITAQYKRCRIELAKKAILQEDFETAQRLLMECRQYPPHLGEGKLTGTAENEIQYYLGLTLLASGRSEEANACFLLAREGIREPADAMFYNDQPADQMLYQGLACVQLGDSKGAKRNFNQLLAYGEKHRSDRKRIDYFAVSLPDFLVFEDDLNERNRMYCQYLLGLGNLGLGNLEQSRDILRGILESDPAHQGAYVHLHLAPDFLSRRR